MNETTLVAEMTTNPARHSHEQLDFSALYRSTLSDIYAYVASVLQDRVAAEDVTAQTFERAFRKRSSYRPRRGSARSWLFTIARNAALDELRKRRRQATISVGAETKEAVNPEHPGTDAHSEQLFLSQTLQTALKKLSGRERELIALKFGAELSNQEIAKVLETSESNAGTQLYRVMLKLRRLCDESK